MPRKDERDDFYARFMRLAETNGLTQHAVEGFRRTKRCAESGSSRGALRSQISEIGQAPSGPLGEIRVTDPNKSDLDLSIGPMLGLLRRAKTIPSWTSTPAWNVRSFSQGPASTRCPAAGGACA